MSAIKASLLKTWDNVKSWYEELYQEWINGEEYASDEASDS